MKIAYLVNVHKNIKQLERLVAKLKRDGSDIFIHIDKKVDATGYDLIISSLYKYNVIIVKDRVDVKWGGFSQVEATINGLAAISKTNNYYDYVCFISGQDYPIKSNQFIIEYFTQNIGYEFMNYCELSPDGWSAAMMRFEKYWLGYFIGNQRVCKFAQLVLTKLLPIRKIPYGYRGYAGSQWWTLSFDCVKYILDFVYKNKDYVNFFKLSLCPDEMFFQTLIMNSKYSFKVYNDNLRYIDWSEGKSNPKVLSKDDFSLIKSSKKLFARKFDSNLDEQVLDMIDDYT